MSEGTEKLEDECRALTEGELRAHGSIKTLREQLKNVQEQLNVTEMLLFREVSINPYVKHPDHARNRYDWLREAEQDDILRRCRSAVRNAFLTTTQG